MKNYDNDKSLSEVNATVDTTKKVSFIKRLFSFVGPAYLVSVGYMDPGNWATDLAGGSQFGYKLIWVLLMSNLMALLLQGFSSRLGIVRGKDLAQINKEIYPKKVNYILYFLAEIAIAATDLAEVLGMAIGINLLTGLPLFWGIAITVLDTFLLLLLQKLGIRKMEAFIIGLVFVIAFSFLIQILYAAPNPIDIAKGLIPSTMNQTALIIAIGIIGATVMPHNLYLHSALVQTRKIEKSKKGILDAIKFNRIDSTIALNIAFLVNASILILAATVFFKNGQTEIASIQKAHELLAPLLGNNLAPKLFAIALIAAGQSSTITGTLAGQIVMEGYLNLRINPWIRRMLTRLLAIVPALIVIGIFGDSKIDEMLILSQVFLSLQLGFAIIPLIHGVSNKEKMGEFVINKYQKIGGWLVATILIILNSKMLFDEVVDVVKSSNLNIAFLAILSFSIFLALLFYILIYPLYKKPINIKSTNIHNPINNFENLQIPKYDKIAIALDFSELDKKLISSAIGQSNSETSFMLIHVVESATAKVFGASSSDYETRKDQELIDLYVQQIISHGFKCEGLLGYRNRVKEIARLVTENNCQMLVIGSHGHSGIKDYIFGETINSVRHEINIPVLIVN